MSISRIKCESTLCLNYAENHIIQHTIKLINYNMRTNPAFFLTSRDWDHAIFRYFPLHCHFIRCDYIEVAPVDIYCASSCLMCFITALYLLLFSNKARHTDIRNSSFCWYTFHLFYAYMYYTLCCMWYRHAK